MRDYSHVVLCYNKTLIEYLAIDLEDPVELDKKGEWTWDTFKNYCERLTVKEEGNTTVIGASMRFTTCISMTLKKICDLVIPST